MSCVNDLRVESRAPGGHPAQRLDELTHVGDLILEQVPDTGRTAARRRRTR